MSDLTSSSIARLAQLTIADGLAFDEDSIDVSVYRDLVDYDALELVNQAYREDTPMPEYKPGSWLDFVFSKPLLSDAKVHVHVLEVVDDSGEAAEELWIKMKSRAALLTDESKNNQTVNDKSINHESEDDELADIVSADTILKSILEQSNLKLKTTSSLSNVNVEKIMLASGPHWLKSMIKANVIASEVNLELPMVITPLDLPERFAGHCYIKLLSPAHSVFANLTAN